MDDHNLARIEGRKPILEALRAGRPIHKIIVAQSAKGSVKEILALARARNIPVQEVAPAHIQALSESNAAQGIVAMAAAKEYAAFEDLLEIPRQKGEEPFFLILDGIEDPHNLGSIIRTAEAAGVHGIIIGKHRAVGLTETVNKVSAGALEYMPVARVTNIAQTIDTLKSSGIWVAGTDMEGESVFNVPARVQGAMALVIGSEGKGISRLVKDKCDFLLSLPMRGNIQSLNASAAAAVFIYETLRLRLPNEGEANGC